MRIEMIGMTTSYLQKLVLGIQRANKIPDKEEQVGASESKCRLQAQLLIQQHSQEGHTICICAPSMNVNLKDLQFP